MIKGLLEYLKLAWTFRGAPRVGPQHLPGTEQRRELTADERFKEAHGYSAATTPLPATADLAKHNASVQAEYTAEVERRQAAYAAGEYTPRFFCDVWNEELHEYLAAVNWDLEMTLAPGRRVDVTQNPGVPMHPILSDPEHFEARMAGALGREVQALEQNGGRTVWKTPRDFIGSRAAILKAVGGIEELADQGENSARRMFGVEDLDAPLPTPVDPAHHRQPRLIFR